MLATTINKKHLLAFKGRDSSADLSAEKNMPKKRIRSSNYHYPSDNLLGMIVEEPEDLPHPKAQLFTPQSGEVGIDVGVASDIQQEQVVGFNDQSAGWMTDVKAGYDDTMDTATKVGSDLGAFLERPVKLTTQSWLVGQPLFFDLNPWEVFLQDSFVRSKIANYELLRGTLHVKCLISGTGFHYGRSLVSYNPYAEFDDLTIQRNFLDVDLVGASQKPHIYLNPSKNEGGEMSLPFFYPNNYISLSQGQQSELGLLTVKSFDSLRHANGGDDPVTIQVWAWMENVSLTMPTSLTAFVPQAGGKKNSKKKTGKSTTMNSGDEYGKGIISAPASAIAKAAGMLEAIPMIAPYARATEMVATKVGQIAALFGYSRPAVISDIVLQKPSPTGNLANVDASDAVNRLTLDSKQELTIDSRTVGLDGADQMGIADICARESYLTSFSMSPSDSVDKLLWNSYVTPNLARAQGTELHLTPMAAISQYFGDWHGTLKFRFQVVKSQFHKGRIIVRYDPRSFGSEVNYNTNYSRVVDLAEEDDFEIEIGWGQARPFLGNQQMSTAVANSYYGTTRLATDSSNRVNGVLEVNVVNSLVSPSTDSPIQIIVSVSACDMKFGNPTADKLRNLHYFPAATPNASNFSPQSGEVAADGESAVSGMPTGGAPITPINTMEQPDDHTMEVFFGESPTSLRELFRRYVYNKSYVSPNPNFQGRVSINTKLLKGLPVQTGYDPEGRDITISGSPGSIGQTSPISFFSPMFAGWRGGLRHKLLFGGSTKNWSNPIVSRGNFSQNLDWQKEEYELSLLNAEQLSDKLGRFTNAGAAATNTGINNTIEYELPYYNGQRFSSARIIGAASNSSQSARVQNVSIDDTGDGLNGVLSSYFQHWVATGEDYNLFFFTGVPVMYNYPMPAPSSF